MEYASQNVIPSTMELGGKSPNLFFSSVMGADDEFLDKAIEGAAFLRSIRAKSALPAPDYQCMKVLLRNSPKEL